MVSPPKVECPGPRLLGTSSLLPLSEGFAPPANPTPTYRTPGRIAWPAPRSALLSCSPVSRVGGVFWTVSQLLGDSQGEGGGAEPPGLCVRICSHMRVSLCACAHVSLCVRVFCVHACVCVSVLRECIYSHVCARVCALASASTQALELVQALGRCARPAGPRGAEPSPPQGGSSSGPAAPPGREIWVLRKPFAGGWGASGEAVGGAGRAAADLVLSCGQVGTAVAA